MLRPSSIASLLGLAAALACGGDADTSPPAAEFLIAAGDSTVWVRAGATGMRARGSAILLAEVDGRFHEVYVADDDRSFYNAVFIGQRVYRRDLITGDSAIIYEDSIVPDLARAYGVRHPAERPLAPDEEASESPRSMATVEVEVLGLIGPYLSVAYHSDTHLEQGEEYHSTRHGVIDIRAGAPTTIARLFGAAAADTIIARGRRAFGTALDSILAAGDTRASRAAESIAGFDFDPSSWALYEQAGSPVVAFLVPGRGERADGLALPLEPIAAPMADWWKADVLPTLPSERSDSVDRWTRSTYSVAARYDPSSDRTRIAVQDSAGKEWQASNLPVPVHRIHWLDSPPIDSLTRQGLARAFDESVFYSDDARSVRHERRRAETGLIQVANRRSFYQTARVGHRWPSRATAVKRATHNAQR